MTALYIFVGIGLCLIAYSPYYRMTALILAASCGLYALMQPITQIESGLIYTFYVLLDALVLFLVLQFGDEGKRRISIILVSMAFLNAWSVIDYYSAQWLNQVWIGFLINVLTSMQVLVMIDGIGAIYRAATRSSRGVLGVISNGISRFRTDP